MHRESKCPKCGFVWHEFKEDDFRKCPRCGVKLEKRKDDLEELRTLSEGSVEDVQARAI